VGSTGQGNEAINEFRKALDLSREYSINLFIPLIVGQLGAALTLAGLHSAAIGLLERVVRELELLGHNIGTVFANYALAAAYRAVGRVEESVRLAMACLENTRRYGFHGVEVRVLLLLGTLQMTPARPDAATAESFIKSSIDLARSLTVRLRSLWRRWHPLEVGNILWRLVPRRPALRVDDSLSGKPIVLVETSHRYAYHTGPP
jgi:hypothetical protein